MEHTAVLHADYLDILFDRRNKSYGGYELRKNYPQRVKRAILFVGLTSCIISIATVFGHTHHTKNIAYNPPVIDLHPLDEPHIAPPKPQPKTEPPAAPKTATAKFTLPDVVKDNLVTPEDKMASPEDLKNKQISTENRAGDETVTDIAAPTDHRNTTGGFSEVESFTPPPPVKWVEQMPEFSGDMQEYLHNHIHYPEAAREAGIQGRVVLQFVVNEDGDITDVVSLKGIGGGCEEEAIRVVQAMPHWKPGKNNGRTVKVLMTLPVTFALE